MNMSTAGTKVTIQAFLFLAVLSSQMVMPISARAASSWLEAPKVCPEDLPGRDRFASGICQGDEDQEHRHATGDDGGDDAAKPTLPTGEFLDDVAAQAGADIQGVIHEGGEGHQTEGDTKCRADADQLHEGADAGGIDEVRRFLQQFAVFGEDHHGGQGNHRDDAFHAAWRRSRSAWCRFLS